MMKMKKFGFLISVMACFLAAPSHAQSVDLPNLPPQVQQLLQASANPQALNQYAGGNLPTGLAQQKQLMQQINNGPTNPSVQNPALAKILQANPQKPPALTASAPQITPNVAAGLQSMGFNSVVNEKSAFDEVITEALPLSPQQITSAKQRLSQSQRTAAGYYVVPPKPVSTSMGVDLSPGAPPPVIRLSQGFVSSLVFLDSTGSPWPIEAYDLGNPAAFNIAWDQKSNTLMIQAMTPFTFGNLAVKLKDLNTPVMLTLIPGQKVVDYRIDLRIQGNGPNAQMMPMQGMPAAEGADLNSILDGIGPAGSKLLQVKGAAGQAWLSGNQLYFRSRLTILSPGWLATLSSGDGMHAYLLPRTPTVLVSQNGKPVQLKIEGL